MDRKKKALLIGLVLGDGHLNPRSGVCLEITHSIKQKSYIENNPKIIEGFTKAINKALEYVRNTDSEIIAKSIYDFFPDMSLNELTNSIERYKSQDTWNETTMLTKESFDHLQDIMILAGELQDKVSFEDLVDNSFN